MKSTIPSRLRSWTSLLGLGILLQLVLLVHSGLPATYIVDNTEDGCYGCPGPAGSLRKAIEDANLTTGVRDTIIFRIPGPGPHVIQPRKAFVITDGVIIDGFSQAGSSLNSLADADNAVRQVVLSAEQLEFPDDAIQLAGQNSNSVVRGLIIDGRFSSMFGSSFEHGVLIADAGGYNEISGNLIKHTCGGVFVRSSSYNVIGGPMLSQRNVIIENRCEEFTDDGIHIQGPYASYNLAQGNFVGIEPDGKTANGNKPDGIKIAEASNNTVGGDTIATRNIVSGNVYDGIGILGTGQPGWRATGNRITGNFIGTDAKGATAVPNQENGVFIEAFGNLVGGTHDPRYPFSPRNLISGNFKAGIVITWNENQVQGNLIGTDATGSTSLPNSQDGVSISGHGNLIGGTNAGTGNVISANGWNGINIHNTTPLAEGPEGNEVYGNLIGTDATGANALGNLAHGVLISQGAFNTVGSLAGSGFNTISGNGGHGIQIEQGAHVNKVRDNSIGTDITGTVALGNKLNGVLITNAPDNTIGPANLISGNRGHGIEIASTSGTLVYQNAVGTDARLGADLGNRRNGIAIAFDAFQNDIGGINGAGNFIGGNDGSGIRIDGYENRVKGNFIGTDFSAAAHLGNCSHGIFLGLTALDNVIGGRANRAGNVIAFNGGTCGAAPGDPIPIGSGVFVSRSSVNNGIFGNSILSNTGLGIDLSPLGVTLNDPAFDADDGANHLQNFPALSDVVSGGGTVTLQISLDSAANTEYQIDFYANRECDPSGYGQGEIYLGMIKVMTDSSGHASAGIILTVVLPKTHRLITATATDPDNNTSEFSQCVLATIENHPPVAKCRDSMVRLASGCDAFVSIDDGSYDPDGDPLTLSQNPPPPYHAGTTTVTLTATDPAGASSSCTATVIVIDALPPAMTCPPNVTQTAAAGKCAAVVGFPLPTATDNCPGEIAISCSPPSGSTFAVGVTGVNCTATDAAGNSSSCTFLVTVKSDADCPVLKIISSSASAASGFMTLTIQTPYFNQEHRIQETADLKRQTWSDVPNVLVTQRNQAGIFQAQFPLAAAPRFYRVIALAPQQ